MKVNLKLSAKQDKRNCFLLCNVLKYTVRSSLFFHEIRRSQSLSSTDHHLGLLIKTPKLKIDRTCGIIGHSIMSKALRKSSWRRMPGIRGHRNMLCLEFQLSLEYAVFRISTRSLARSSKNFI